MNHIRTEFMSQSKFKYPTQVETILSDQNPFIFFSVVFQQNLVLCVAWVVVSIIIIINVS